MRTFIINSKDPHEDWDEFNVVGRGKVFYTSRDRVKNIAAGDILVVDGKRHRVRYLEVASWGEFGLSRFVS